MGKKKIYIVFTDTGTMFTKLIKLYTKKSLNHASLSFDDQLSEMYSFGRKQPLNPFIGGFVREKIAEGLFKKAKCEVYSYEVSELEYEQMHNKVRKIELKKDKYKYNLLGLFAIIFNYNLKRTNTFFCSQFVATILNEKNDVLEKSPNLYTPQDLMNMKNIQLIYRGKLNLYPYQVNEERFERGLELSFEKLKIYNTPGFSKYKTPS